MKVWILEYTTTKVLAVWEDAKYIPRANEYMKLNDLLYIVKEISWDKKDEVSVFIDEVKMCSYCDRRV